MTSKDATAATTTITPLSSEGNGKNSNNSSNNNSSRSKNKKDSGNYYSSSAAKHSGRPKEQQIPITASKSRPLLLRIPSNLLESLKGEAARDDASVNSLIITVLKKHTSWGRFQGRLGFMPLHKSMILTMLDKLTPEEIEEVGKMQKDQTIRDFLLFDESGYNLKSFMQWIELRCKVLGFELLIRQEGNDSRSSVFVMIHHNMGENWSLYYKGMFSAVLQELLPPDGEVYDQITFDTGRASFAMHLVGVKMDAKETRIDD